MTKILAIDIGTASVSAAVAEQKMGEKADVRNVFRYYYDASSSDNSKLLLRAVSRIFNDAHKVEKNFSSVRISFSSPFFLEQSIGLETKRENPKVPVSANEVTNLLLAMKNKFPKDLEMIFCDIISYNVDGYEVPEPYGYIGEILKIEAKTFAISKFLKSQLYGLKDKFFPSSDVYYISDGEALKKLAFTALPKISPAVLDVGAEISALNSQILPFGIRALERKVASFLNISLLDAENMLRKLTYGTLDYARERAVNRIIGADLSAWSEMIKENLSSVKNKKKLFISGAGADFNILIKTINEDLKNLYNFDMDIGILSPNYFKENFFHFGGLSGGKDAVLTALILIHD